MVELAWLWLQNQPASGAQPVVPRASPAQRRTDAKDHLVALARKLLVALWRYVSAASSLRRRDESPLKTAPHHTISILEDLTGPDGSKVADRYVRWSNEPTGRRVSAS